MLTVTDMVLGHFRPINTDLLSKFRRVCRRLTLAICSSCDFAQAGLMENNLPHATLTNLNNLAAYG